MKVILIGLLIMSVLFVAGIAVFFLIIAKVGGKVFGNKRTKQESRHRR